MKFLLFLLISFPVFAKVEVVGSEIHITDDANFEAKLEVKNFVKAEKEAFLKETGFIVANTQTSFENDKFISRWITLDPNILKNNKIELDEINPVKGYAYGVISTSKDFGPQLKIGQEISIKRYGLDKDHFTAKIHNIRKKGQDIIQIYFLATHAVELIAGTTCEVEIAQIRMVPYKVSILSLLHLGLEDYIVIRKSPGVYYPRHATIIDQDSQNATILVPIQTETEYVARGAILLKPLLNQILYPKKDKP